MAFLCFLVLCSVLSHSVFARDCNMIESTNNCDECFRCGGNWCRDPQLTSQCTMASLDSWCPNHQEQPHAEDTIIQKTNTFFKASSIRKYIGVGRSSLTNIEFIPDVKGKIYKSYHKLNAQQSVQDNIAVSTEVIRPFGKSQIRVRVEVKDQFCSNSSRIEEVSLTVGLNDVTEVVNLLLNVECYCGCSDRVEKKSPVCNKRGDLICGVCHCEDGWVGKFCKNERECSRGDLGNCIDTVSDNRAVCSGNGRCKNCEKCECHNDPDVIGSQYFDEENYCHDICFVASRMNNFDDCVYNNEEGPCNAVFESIQMHRLNTTVKEDRDENNRTIWVPCHSVVKFCPTDYLVMQNSTGHKHVMVIKGCNPPIMDKLGPGVIVPVSFLVIAVLGAAMVAAVKVFWSTPKMTTMGPGYENIDPVDNTGVNPLYVEPISSFKNPMYGKS